MAGIPEGWEPVQSVDVDRAINAIKMTESMGDFNESGGSGEKGAFQIMPGTWAKVSREYAKQKYGIDSVLPMTPDHQESVARNEIEKLAKRGYGIEEIASTWNSGGHDPSGKIGINQYGQKYNTPSYVKLVKGYYEKQAVPQGWEPVKEPEPMTAIPVGWEPFKESVEPTTVEPPQSNMDKAVSGVKELGKYGLDVAGKTVGATLGTLNAPVAFLYGGLAERYNNPEEYAKMPLWEQMLTTMGGAADSAWRSISKPGDWGTMYGEYVQKATGKTIEEQLPDGLKWAAPTLEFIGNAVSDPLLVGGVAKDIANLKDVRKLIPKMPENSKILNDLDAIAKLEGQEKIEAQKAFLELLKNRQAQKVEEAAKQEEAVRQWMRDKGWTTENPFEGQRPEPTPQPTAPPEYQTPWFRSAERQVETPQGNPFEGQATPQTQVPAAQVDSVRPWKVAPEIPPEAPPVAQPVPSGPAPVGTATTPYQPNPFIGKTPEKTPYPFETRPSESIRPRVVEEKPIAENTPSIEKEIDLDSLPPSRPAHESFLESLKEQEASSAKPEGGENKGIFGSLPDEIGAVERSLSAVFNQPLSGTVRAASGIPSEHHKTAAKIVSDTGFRPIFWESDHPTSSTVNGFVDDEHPEKIFIRADSNIHPGQLAVHEVVHRLADHEPKLYEELRSSVLPGTIKFNEYVRELNSQRFKAGLKPLSTKDAEREFLADIGGASIFADDNPSFIKPFNLEKYSQNTSSTANDYLNILDKFSQKRQGVIPEAIPSGVGIGPRKTSVQSLEEIDKMLLHEAKQELAEAEKWTYKTEEGRVTGRIGGTYPKWFTNKGYKQDGINTIIEKALNGDRLTSTQQSTVRDILDSKTMEWKQKYGTSDLTMMRSAAGGAYGFSEDENGNVTFEPEKALLGVGIAAGVSHLNPAGAKKFKETLARNPAMAKIASQIGEKDPLINWAGILPKLGSTLLDRFWPIKKISKPTYDETRTFSSYKDVAAIYLKELQDDLKPVSKDEGNFTLYTLAHRNIDRAQRGIKNPKGVTIQDARDAIREIEDGYIRNGKDPQILVDALEGFIKFGHDRILEPLKNEGIISQEAYDAIKANNNYYAAFDVLDQMPDIGKRGKPNFIPGKEYFTVSQQGIVKSLVGTEKQIGNPIEATLKKFMDAHALMARNRVARTFIEDVTTNPDPAIQSLLRPVATSQKEFATMAQNGLNPVMEGRWGKASYDTITYLDNGKTQKYLAPKEVADSMKQLTPFQAPRIIQGLNTIFRSAATSMYLPFTVSNAMRDALMAYVTTPGYKTMSHPQFVMDWGKGAYEAGKEIFGGGSQVVKDYLKSGGGFGWSGEFRRHGLSAQLFDEKLLGKGVDVVTSPLRLIDKISDVIELTPRIGIYQRELKSGASMKDAAFMAREGTIDFSRGGSLMKVVNQFVPFLNARVQARVQVAEALRNDTKNTLSKIFVATTIPAIALYAWNRLNYPELLDDIRDNEKRNYFNIITGSTVDDKGRTVPTRLVIPKGDVGQMGANFAEYLLDKAYGKDKRGTLNFLSNFLNDVVSPVDMIQKGSFSPEKVAGGVLPPIVKGAAENWANRSFYFGRDIENMGDLRKPPELRYDEKTPESYKWIGDKMGWSPKKIQNFMSNVLAGYGREGLDPTSMLKGLTGRFYRESGGEKANLAGDIIKDIEKGYESTRAYAENMIEKGDAKGALNLIRAWNIGLSSQIKKTEEFGFKDKGGLIKSYVFTPEKIKNIVTKKPDNRPWIEKKISVR